MLDNVYICLLIVLIAYLIFKISSNTCNGFNVGSQIEPPSPPPPPPPPSPRPPPGPKITLQPYDKNAKGLFDRLKKAYNDPTSNGVFGSMIFNNPTLKENFFNQLKLLKDNLTNESPQIYLDGSAGSKSIIIFLLEGKFPREKILFI